ncbi:MAG: hypothetical protein SGPRY_000948 [Prymnesium sp.]
MSAFPPAPVELCRWPTAALRSFDPNSIRDVLRPIGLALADHFGFQVGQEHDNGKSMCSGQIVHSNLDNQIEHLVLLLKWRMDRTSEEDPQMALWRATDELHHKTLENYRRWVKYVDLQEGNTKSSAAGLETSPHNGFLNSIITPMYKLLEHELSKRINEPIAERVMYDDLNETFWSTESIQALLPAGSTNIKRDGLLVEPEMPRRAYVHFQKLLGEAMKQDDPIGALKQYFKKTYCDWSPSTCPEVNDWCASNIDMNVPYEHVPRCTTPGGVDLLSKYCIECVINHFDNTTAKCEVLRDFTEECIALCDSDISYDPIFQVRTCSIVTKITLLEEDTLGQASILPDIRNVILKATLLMARIISPIMIFTFDTSLIFAWILSLVSVIMGVWMKLGKEISKSLSRLALLSGSAGLAYGTNSYGTCENAISCRISSVMRCGLPATSF